MKPLFLKLIRSKEERELMRTDVVYRSIHYLNGAIGCLFTSLIVLIISLIRKDNDDILFAIFLAFFGVIYGFFLIRKVLLIQYKTKGDNKSN